MKLFNVPNNTWVRSLELDCTDIFFFGHIDGMYSYCRDLKDNLVHYVAWMEVEKIENSKESK